MRPLREVESAQQLGRFLCSVAVCGGAFIVPLLFAPAHAIPFLVPKEVAFEVAAALGLLGWALQSAAPASFRDGGRALRARPVAVGAVLVLASIGLSAGVAWLRGPLRGAYAGETALRWGALFALACATSVVGRFPASRLALFQAVTASAAAVGAIGLAQHFEVVSLSIPVISAPGSTFGNRNLAGEAVALSLPFAFAAICAARSRGEEWVLLAAVAVECLYLAATRARGAWMGGVAGAVTFALLNRRAWSRSAVVTTVGIVVVSMAVALTPGRANSRYAGDSKRLANGVDVIENTFNPDAPALRTRLGLWRRSLAMFWTAPITGIGPGNWAVVFPAFAEPGASADGVLSPGLAARQAHNDALEVLTETGLVGEVSLLILAVATAATARRNLRSADGPRRVVVSAAAASLVALAVVGLPGFPLEMPATAMLAGLALGLVSGADGAAPAAAVENSRGRSPFEALAIALRIALVALVTVTVAVTGTRRLYGSAWLGVAERALRGDPGPAAAKRALRALDSAERANPGSFRVALRAAQAATRLDWIEAATAAADRALATEPYSPNAWATLANIQLRGGDAKSARASAERALGLLEDYPFALFLQARAAEGLGDRAGSRAARAHLERLATSPSGDPTVPQSAKEFLEMTR